jgi:hypothetical protein
MKFSCSISLSVQKIDSDDPTSLSVSPIIVGFSQKRAMMEPRVNVRSVVVLCVPMER